MSYTRHGHRLRFFSATERTEKKEILRGFPQSALCSLWQKLDKVKPQFVTAFSIAKPIIETGTACEALSLFVILNHCLLFIARLIQLADHESPHQPEDKHKRRKCRDDDHDDPDQEFDQSLVGIGHCA